MKRTRQKSKRSPWKSNPDLLDKTIISLFEAITNSLGRPFKAHESNCHTVTEAWNPLLHDSYSDFSVLDFAKSYLPSHFFKRWIFASELKSTTPEEKAFEKFERSSMIGVGVNEMLKSMPSSDHPLCKLLSEMREYIYEVVGEFSDEDIYDGCMFGPGATTAVSRRRAFKDVKTLRFDGSDDQRQLFELYLTWFNPRLKAQINSLYLSRSKDLADDKSSRLEYVDKSYKVKRPVQIPTTLAGFLQQGPGSFLTSRLYERCNIDLSSQPYVHQNLVRISSREPDVQIATLDWSDASDRIWVNLVRLLVPPHLFWWLSVTRSTTCTYHGESYNLEMIGTMGNAFTFPLQTLVFRAFFHAIGRIHNIDDTTTSVFGDDCIVHCDMVPWADYYSELLGWSVNNEKTFDKGAFRESCGTDCFHGIDVRPVMPKRPNWAMTRIGFKAFMYILYNTVSLRIRPHCVSFDPVNDWLKETWREYDLGAFYYVPLDYPEYSGIRVSIMTASLETAIVFDEHGGTEIRCIGNRPERRQCWDFPYFQSSLRSCAASYRSFEEFWNDDIESRLVTNEPYNRLIAEKQVHLEVVKPTLHQWCYGGRLSCTDVQFGHKDLYNI